ncbi:MAG: hypothetical protein JNN03_15460 [Rubrivivax sp.]|nr:hypothetical protein [Rubrivivax sp.]
MSNATRLAVSALVAFLCTAASTALLYAAKIPFPPPLALDAIAQWLVFAAVVHSVTRLGFFLAQRVAPELANAAASSRSSAA